MDFKLDYYRLWHKNYYVDFGKYKLPGMFLKGSDEIGPYIISIFLSEGGKMQAIYSRDGLLRGEEMILVCIPGEDEVWACEVEEDEKD